MVLLSIIGGCVVVLGAWLTWWNIRRMRTAGLAASLPAGTRERVLAAIDRAGAEQGSGVLLLRVVDGPGRDPYSKIGGEPLGEKFEDPGAFLGQVRLCSPPLPEVWSNRVVYVFEEPLGTVVARCGVLVAAAAPVEAAGSPASERGIEVWRLPPGDTVDDEDGYVSSPYAPGSLCRRVPALRELLAGHADSPERLLPHILVPASSTHEIDTHLVCLMGGEPELIQSEHRATCSQCGRPMHFLLQLGDVLGLPGDAPVVYVYGCDEHPAEVRSYVDLH